jgi:hypothetical protein
MKLGFFLGDVQQVGKHGELSLDRDGAKRTQQCGYIFGGVLRLQSVVEIVALRLLQFFRLAAMSQIDLATACIHGWYPGMAVSWHYYRLSAARECVLEL